MAAEWKPEITRAICRRCSGCCCTDPLTQVVLDYEKKVRKLSHYNRVSSGVPGRAPYLKKDRTGACVYFDRETNGCGIYLQRPLACKAWFCGRGTKNDEVWLTLKRRA
jgi:Fe-S-cluster containining protein